MEKDKKSVLIIGAGTFGLSTALHLLRQADVEVTLLDPYPVPSLLSAGNDVNKIVQSTSEDEFYSKLASEALDNWRGDDVFKNAFHETGIIYAATSQEEKTSIDHMYKDLEKKNEQLEKLNSPAEFLNVISRNRNENVGNRFNNWYGYYQKSNCGWTFAKSALESCATECERLGANFITDSAEELLFNESQECIGVRTYSGKILEADRTVICAGANSYKLLDFEDQLLAKCWTVGHIKLDKEEALGLKGMPVILKLDQGFVFEPDSNDEIKFCNEFPGYINLIEGNSVPLYKDAIPKEAEDQMREFLRHVFPQFAEREFSVAKICWCTDTPDRHFLICEHPKFKNLILGTGDSGQGFKYMPIIGKYIAGVVIQGDDYLNGEKKSLWKWRPLSANGRNIYDTQNRYGGTNKVLDLKDIKTWT